MTPDPLPATPPDAARVLRPALATPQHSYLFRLLSLSSESSEATGAGAS